MGFPLLLALRYLRSKKRQSVSVGTAFATIGVTLGVAALAIVMSVTGGFQEQFRNKVLGVNAHVLVLKYSIDFREYRDVMKKCEKIPGVVGVAPFIINPMMVTHGDRTATGVLLKGVDPELMPKVLDLPKHITAGTLDGLRREGAKPPERRSAFKPAPIDTAPVGTQTPLEMLGIPDPGSSGVAITPLPTGAVTPDGGYQSQLPPDDALPDEIDPDPCKSPEQVKKMPGIVVGRTLAKQLGVDIGDCVQVTSPTIGLAFGASSRPPIAKQFRVIATFEAGFDQYDSKLVYTDLYEAQAFYDQGDSVTGVEMKVDDIDDSKAITQKVDRSLGNSVYHTMDWMDLNHGLFTALLIQQIGMSVVLALIIVVAAFTVVATLIMIVLDKKKEIALLKALGARDSEILRAFLYQGAIIGMVGTLSGLAVGYACCKGLLAYSFPLDPKVYFISSLPVSVRPQEFLITGAFSLFICLVATMFPALYAANLRPADGLRAE
ncbi:hypothetical protein BH09MYX1_BH09MYX1_07420 [soil metagenome]